MRSFYAISVLTCCLTLARADNWPDWRGPARQGHSTERELPLRWSATENVRWKVPLPDDGNSTPVVWGNRIFLTQAVGKGVNSRRMIWCLDRADGKKLWEKGVTYPEKEPTHATNPYCSASPATDGERVVVSFGSAGMYCYDFEGKELWTKDLGKLEHIWGNASSPILHGDLAILWCGPGERQYLLAVNKRTGAEVWRHDEPGGASGLGGNKSWVGSWSTPIIVRVGDHDELVLSVPEKLKGFDPATGKELWSCAGLGKLVYTSPVHADGIVVAMSGYGGPALACRLGGRGDVTQTHRLWRHPRATQRIGSPAIIGGLVYLVEESGVPRCYELKTGKEIWQVAERQSGTTWSSAVAAGGRLYVASHSGDTVVLRADPKFERLARSSLGERVLSSVAVSDGELFIRSYKNLWCIASKRK
jgi:outer membrane protein assembly factor BamB